MWAIIGIKQAVAITQGLQASALSLSGNDYNKAGNATDNPVEGANRIDITGMPGRIRSCGRAC